MPSLAPGYVARLGAQTRLTYLPIVNMLAISVFICLQNKAVILLIPVLPIMNQKEKLTSYTTGTDLGATYSRGSWPLVKCKSDDLRLSWTDPASGFQLHVRQETNFLMMCGEYCLLAGVFWAQEKRNQIERNITNLGGIFSFVF